MSGRPRTSTRALLISKPTPEGHTELYLLREWQSGNHHLLQPERHLGRLHLRRTQPPLTVVDNRLQGNKTTTYTYDPASNVATVATPNGLTSSFTYDALNRLTAMTRRSASYNYQFGPTGNRTSATEGNGRTAHLELRRHLSPDQRNHRRRSASNNGSASYGLDPVGNRPRRLHHFPASTPAAGTIQRRRRANLLGEL